jgi:hypothetical protein
VAGSCVYGNEPSGSIKGGEFLHQLCVCQASQGLFFFPWIQMKQWQEYYRKNFPPFLCITPRNRTKGVEIKLRAFSDVEVR